MIRRGSRIVCLSLLASTSGGCLLWSDPINTAPTVSIKCPQEGLIAAGEVACPAEQTPSLFRGDNAFQAVASDKNQSADSLTFEWWYADKSCKDIFDGPSLDKSGVASFHHLANDLGNGCVGVMVTDHQGATASAKQLFSVVDQAPTADLQMASTAASMRTPSQPLALPLFTKAVLTGRGSTDPDEGDPIDFLWSVYQGDTLISMPGCPDPTQEPYLCTFVSAIPGNFRVQLLVADNWKQSPPVEQLIEVAADQPPNIVVETVQPAPPFPPDQAPLQLPASLANSFTVLRVEDDGDPYPSANPLSPYPAPPAGFVWSYKSSSSPSFQRVIGQTGPSFTIPAGTFNPRDSIRVRVEYRDRVTAYQPITTTESCPPLATICHGAGQRVQSVTWAVDFR